MTETQVRLVRILIATMVGVSFYQALVIQRLAKRLKYGKAQFDKLHEAADYLLKVIDENDIELTEFDLIALTAISEGNNETSSL